ncbi:hypothetical protein SUGI_1185210 [Cryptomeria japonica]|nr:hypothetical protein SUGI_1185210 [Cryptomeria japonica]
MQRLTLPLISAQHPDKDLATITTLSFPKRGITQIVGLDACEKLSRLDLSNNSLSSIEGLALCSNLKWLSVAGNCLQSLKGIEGLVKLTVLNASHNELTSMDEVSLLVDLRALILNDNEIDSICRLDRLINLNTLVLSHNPIRELGKSLAKISSISKLSLSYCRLQTIGTSLKCCVDLKELRLAHNQLMNLPKELEQNGKLQILDLGHNHLRLWSEIQVIGVLHELKNLNLHGNGVCEDEQYQSKVKELLPNLQILDGHPIASIPNHQKKRNRSSKGHDHEDLSEDANAIIANLATHKNKGHETTRKRHSKESKGEDKKERKLDKNESDDDRPFIDLIAPLEKATELKINAVANIKKRKSDGSGDLPILKEKVDSGVVSILEGNTKGIQPKGRVGKLGPMFLRNLREVEIGTGGPSSWEPKPEESKSQENQVNSGASSHNEYTFRSSSYSRWKLKGSRTEK